ncbi:MAG: AraC family transcriptional regulator [Bacteroidales bacterium]
MLKNEQQIKPEYRQAVSKALHYINQNLTADISLETLARIANYSAFHFQKIFLLAISETPKQYVMRLRLERAAHYLKVFPDLPIYDIAMGCGFSSPSVFSRAFRNYYKLTAEKFRLVPLSDTSAIANHFHKINKSFVTDNSFFPVGILNNNTDSQEYTQIIPPPTVKTFNAIKIACIATTLNHPESISFAFKSLMQWVIPNELHTINTKYIGIWLDTPFYTSLDKCRYLAGIILNEDIKSKKGIEIISMKEGKYAGFSMTGNIECTLNQLISLNHQYLDDMGYEMAEIICYEIFDECPAYKSFEQINKNILLPVKTKQK